MRVSLRSNIDAVLTTTAQLHPQFKFAAALAMTKTVLAIKAAMPAELERDLDRPTAFTKRGFFVKPARRDDLRAEVGVMDRQRLYLVYQVEGGTRQPKNVALRLPSTVNLDDAGNMPKGLVAQLIAAAKSGKIGKRMAQRSGVDQKAQLFYGKPANTNMPAGIYRREKRGGRSVLVPLVVFPRQAAKYERRFDFYGVALRITKREFEPNLRAAWARAQATARR